MKMRDFLAEEVALARLITLSCEDMKDPFSLAYSRPEYFMQVKIRVGDYRDRQLGQIDPARVSIIPPFLFGATFPGCDGQVKIFIKNTPDNIKILWPFFVDRGSIHFLVRFNNGAVFYGDAHIIEVERPIISCEGMDETSSRYKEI